MTHHATLPMPSPTANAPSMPDSRPSILVFRSAALGDFILASPALRMLRLTYPAYRIVLLTTQSSNKKVRDSVAKYTEADAIPWVRLAMPHLLDDVVSLQVSLAPKYLLSLRTRLRPYCVEKVVLLLDPAAPWAGRLKKLLLLKLLVGNVPTYGWRGNGSLNGDRAKLHRKGVLRHHVHGSMQFLSELHPARTYADADIQFDLRPSSDAESWADAWLAANVPSDARLVCIAPGSIQPHKRWPQEKFAQLCRALLEHHMDLFLVVIGTPSDSIIGAELQMLDQGRIANLAGKSTIEQSAALLKRASLLVGNDGGAMHLGDAMGSKVVSVVPGIEYPDSIEPWNNRARTVRHSVPCAPCYNFLSCPLGHNICMRDLPLEKTLEQCLLALEEIVHE